MINILGALGSFLLAVCAVPEVYSSVKKGYCGTSLGLLSVWGFGEFITLIYICLTSVDMYLIANYTINIVFILILLYYKTKPVKLQPIKTLDFTKLKDFNAQN